MERIMGFATAALVLLVSEAALSAVRAVPDDGACESGKGIERTLGRHGYRVVVSGGGDTENAEAIKIQVWENDEGQWVITEAFVGSNRTCVVRSGDQLHMMY